MKELIEEMINNKYTYLNAFDYQKEGMEDVEEHDCKSESLFNSLADECIELITNDSDYIEFACSYGVLYANVVNVLNGYETEVVILS